MKQIKTLLLVGIFALCLVNFSSAGSLTITGNFNNSSFISSYGGIILMFPLIDQYHDYTFTCTCNDVGSPAYSCDSIDVRTVSRILNYYQGTYFDGTPVNIRAYVNGNYNINYIFGLVGYNIINKSYNFDYTCVLSGDNIPSDSSSSPGSCSVNDKILENIIFSGTKDFSNAGYTNMFNYGDYGAGTYCMKFTSSNPQQLTMGFANGGTTTPTNLYSLYADQYGNWICLYGNKSYLNVKLNSNSNTISYEVYKLTDLLSSSIPCSNGSSSSSCDTGSILSGYILESSVNQSYCENNNLCSVCDYSEYESQISSLSGSLNSCQNSLGASSTSLSSCQNSLSSCLSANCPSVGVSWSSLFINDIQHLGASNIYMSIPEELEWNYTYTDSGNNMEIDVEGYNVDYDYINGVVNVQKYKPSSEDFTQVVGILAPYMKIFLFLLFIFIVIKRLKKPFKSRLK